MINIFKIHKYIEYVAGKFKTTPEIVQQIGELFSKGFSDKDIGYTLGISQQLLDDVISTMFELNALELKKLEIKKVLDDINAEDALYQELEVAGNLQELDRLLKSLTYKKTKYYLTLDEELGIYDYLGFDNLIPILFKDDVNELYILLSQMALPKNTSVKDRYVKYKYVEDKYFKPFDRGYTENELLTIINKYVTHFLRDIINETLTEFEHLVKITVTDKTTRESTLSVNADKVDLYKLYKYRNDTKYHVSYTIEYPDFRETLNNIITTHGLVINSSVKNIEEIIDKSIKQIYQSSTVNTVIVKKRNQLNFEIENMVAESFKDIIKWKLGNKVPQSSTVLGLDLDTDRQVMWIIITDGISRTYHEIHFETHMEIYNNLIRLYYNQPYEYIAIHRENLKPLSDVLNKLLETSNEYGSGIKILTERDIKVKVNPLQPSRYNWTKCYILTERFINPYNIIKNADTSTLTDLNTQNMGSKLNETLKQVLRNYIMTEGLDITTCTKEDLRLLGVSKLTSNNLIQGRPYINKLSIKNQINRYDMWALRYLKIPTSSVECDNTLLIPEEYEGYEYIKRYNGKK